MKRSDFAEASSQHIKRAGSRSFVFIIVADAEFTAPVVMATKSPEALLRCSAAANERLAVFS